MLEDVLGQPIAAGRTSELYRWRLGKVLKLFRAGFELAVAEREARIARDARSAGLRVPLAGNLVVVNGRVGVEYDFFEEQTLLKSLASQPWHLIQLAHRFAQLHREIHKCEARGLPEQHALLERRIREAAPLSIDQRQAMLAILAALPRGERLCHGDLHPDNVLIGGAELTIVDWAEASAGNPIADVAKSALVLQVSPMPAGTPHPWMLEAGRWAFRQLYLNYYFEANPIGQDDFPEWFGVVAAARLSDGSPEEFPSLLRIVESCLRQTHVEWTHEQKTPWRRDSLVAGEECNGSLRSRVRRVP